MSALARPLHLPTTVPALTFGFGVLLLVLRSFPPSALTLGRLPTPQLAKAFRVLAVTLIPGPRQKRPTAARPVTSPRRKPRGARRTPGRGAMLFSSHGRWCSRWGRPRDGPSSLGHLDVDEPAACGDSNLPDTWRRLQDTRHASDRSMAGRRSRPPPIPHPLSTAGPTDRRPRCARPPSRNDEGNREGDCLELVRLLKETIPSKDTSERRKPRRKYRRRVGRRRRSTQPSD